MLERLSDDEIMQEYPLKNLIRYNTRTKIKDETVSDHTCFVSLFCLKILSQLEIDDLQIFKDTIALALLHDLPESMTSDVPWDVKQRDPDIKKALEEFEDEYYKLYWSDYESSLETKSGLPGAILTLADVYSVYQYVYNEISLGNHTEGMREIFENSRRRITEAISNINKIMEENK